MFPGLNGKRKRPDWLRHIDHCRPVKRAAFALDAPLGLEHTLPALRVARTAGLGDGAQLSMLLVAVQPVKAVVAQMKDQVYVSITDYISSAKGKLIGHGHTWNESHYREARRDTRSEICGKDTAKQDEGLDLGTAFRLGIGADLLVPGDMCNLVLALEVGTVFTLREIVLSASPASAVAFDKVKFALPLFPQCNGDATGKTSVVKSAEYVECILGEDLVNQQGRNLLLRSQHQDYGGEKFCLVRHTYGHDYAPVGRVLRHNFHATFGSPSHLHKDRGTVSGPRLRLPAPRGEVLDTSRPHRYQRHTHMLSPVRSEQVLRHLPQGVHDEPPLRRATAPGPRRAFGYTTAGTASGRTRPRQDVSPEGLRSRCLPTERAAARAARINPSSDGDNQVAD